MSAHVQIIPAEFPVARMGGERKDRPVLAIDSLTEVNLSIHPDAAGWLTRLIDEATTLRNEVQAREAVTR